MDEQKPHLHLAFIYWQTWLKPTDTVIDATCGNGKDTLRLASLVPQGKVLSIDIQEDALIQAKKRVISKNVFFFLQSHTSFPPANHVKLIVYNLGYLPFGNKSITTLSETTIKSLQEALKMVFWGGAISINCYPGHPEGEKETKTVFAFVKTLDPLEWKIEINQWKDRSPSLIWIEKIVN